MKSSGKKLNMVRGGFVFFLLLLVFAPCITFAASAQGGQSDVGVSMSMLYGVIAGISLLLLIGYGALVKKKVLWLLLLFTSVFLANAGYFSLSISKTLEEALLANRIAYLGSVFLPFFMLMTMIGVCRYPCRRWMVALLICINVAVFLIAASPGYTGWYYKEVTLVFVNGAAKLKKVYGSLHKIYFVFLFSYFAMMVGVILRAVRKRRVESPKQALLLLIVVFLNIAFWLVEQLVQWDFEFLSVSYIISELLLLCLYSMLQDYEELKERVKVQPHTVKEETKAEDDLEQKVAHWSEIAQLSPREKDVFRELLMDKKRKEIAEALCISENTVKTHTSNVFSKLEVSTRNELIEKVKHDKN
ncbi:LuxR C-terminal-related transcriptional regulator [Anaerotignum sp.]|nr:LuxR C-terminal-related transcriptional regulator [Anaerotignum sp.]MBQ7757696.1 hypothetical protein [Anaerotignum sp.]